MASDRRPKADPSRRASLIKLLFALLALILGFFVLRDYWRGQPIAAAFTRVGGPTRVETAVEASRFWLTPPTSVVTTPANASQEIMWGAARCAMVHDAPLLFTSHDPRRQRLVAAMIDGWRKNATRGGRPRFEEPDVRSQHDVTVCLRNGDTSNVKGLSTLAVSDRPLQLPEVEARTKLAPVVVFAAAKTPTDSPDVAVGLVLAAHMATTDREASLIVVPRYLQADPELEAQLRKRHELVKSGVVLGRTGILSEDTRLLLRQVLTSTDRQGLLGEIRTDLGPLEVLLAALFALWGGATAARVAPELVRAVRGNPQTPRRSDMLGTRVTRNGRQTNPESVAWVTALDELRGLDELEVIVWLRSGWRVSGIVKRGADHADVSSGAVLRLKDAKVTSEEPGSPTPADFVLVRVENIELISVNTRSNAGAPTP